MTRLKPLLKEVRRLNRSRFPGSVFQTEPLIGVLLSFQENMIKMSLNEGQQPMQPFEYRHPRFSVDLPAELAIGNQKVAARCTDISIRGMSLDVPCLSASGDFGTVLLRYHNETILLKVRIAHKGPVHSGVEFLYDSSAERSIVAHLVASLARPPSRCVLALVPRMNASLGGPLRIS